MFLFSLIGSLFGLVLNLLLLPLRLIGLPVAMLLLPFRMILRLFARHTILALLILGAIFLVFQFRHNTTQLPQLTPAKSAPKNTANVPPTLIEAVLKNEDGDSSFATDLYALMTEPERGQYSKNFYYAMNSMKDAQVHQWASYNVAGSLRPNDTFANKSGERCRHFNEVLKVHSIQQTISGTACERPLAV
jgi:surface antigen